MDLKVKMKPSTLLNPVPVVMVSCRGTSERYNKPNIITIAWTGTINSEPPMISISIRKSRFSHQQITESREFCVNLVDIKLLKSCDYCGVKSGFDVNKFHDCGLNTYLFESMNFAPAINEAPVSLACKVKSIIELGSHDMFIAEIIDVTVNNSLINDSGKLDLGAAQLISYNHGEYFMLAKEPSGFFGFSIASDSVLKRRLKKVSTSKKHRK